MSCNKSLKRKRVVLSLDEKCDILRRLKTGETGTALSQKYNIGKSTISAIKSNEDKILKYQANMLVNGNYGSNKKSMSTAENDHLESAVFLWFLQQRTIGTPITGPILCEKALQLNKKIGGSTNFKASKGWLRNFKARHGIRLLNIQAEKQSINAEAGETFKKNLCDFIQEQNYSEDCIYNADQSSLCWRSLPQKQLSVDCKTYEDRVTIMVCFNATGSHRLPLFMIGKAQKPKCLKYISSLPIIYKTQKNGWMNTDLFKSWYLLDFIPNVKKYQEESGRKGKVLLILNNVPLHSLKELNALTDEMFHIRFLPINITSVIQSMNQGIIEKVKRTYRKHLLNSILGEDKQNLDVLHFLKHFALQDCCHIIHKAWNLVTKENLYKEWKKLLYDKQKIEVIDKETNNDIEEILQIHHVAKRISCSDNWEIKDTINWLRSDENDHSFQVLNDEEIICEVAGYNAISEAEEMESTEEPESSTANDYNKETIPTDAHALAALNIAIKWFEAQAESNIVDLQRLNYLRDLASSKIFNK
nr:PREDICTED: jerky protein homolog-like [Megachile rotundata]